MTREEIKKAMRDTKREIVIKNLHKLLSLVEGYPEYEDCVSYAIEELEQETVLKEPYDHEYFLRKEFEIKIAKLEHDKNKVLDKIRAEILEYIDDLDIADAICEVFDKYKAES